MFMSQRSPNFSSSPTAIYISTPVRKFVYIPYSVPVDCKCILIDDEAPSQSKPKKLSATLRHPVLSKLRSNLKASVLQPATAVTSLSSIATPPSPVLQDQNICMRHVMLLDPVVARETELFATLRVMRSEVPLSRNAEQMVDFIDVFCAKAKTYIRDIIAARLDNSCIWYQYLIFFYY